eukprot:2766956-Pyramimonas_sp.AAC.1
MEKAREKKSTKQRSSSNSGQSMPRAPGLSPPPGQRRHGSACPAPPRRGGQERDVDKPARGAIHGPALNSAAHVVAPIQAQS